MFTGIIETVGNIDDIIRNNDDISIVINTDRLDISDLKLGDSIASNGVCLTVSELTPIGFVADLTTETLRRTAYHSYHVGQKLNLEKAMLPTTRLGGHIVSGHVDGIGDIIELKRKSRTVDIWITVPIHLKKFISEKGSICVDGTSLTISAVYQNVLKLTIIPHTLANTTLVNATIDQQVNIEVDMMARYLERLISMNKQEYPKSTNVSMSLLEKHGFVV
ncbi:riboflavin synthase [Photobacterium leiognathi]|uniref:Riboflavin synthase n=1 Tax=Photobacterium leiognathi subsp. mandapamensis TaxID=48408 RepID=A0A2T3KU36_PHOLD|nr:riboflavin synthase [Photobacterium leiognathi]PSV10266.1 riboflavin synthase [Photobacterium leiognathi subsp. mandapamensis]PSW52827.1 riboflavin synthase [Photobacterium leiognathi subsp. mandapamensis]PSW65189.1 riboflavin synthase [Photobacterium leiognathi subsp. mandapamensis]GAA05715.1 riboflavin synthase, alpha subunit (ribE) [Photobacterium leiognathi subsp. mandapamensis svers.1.1.]